LEKKEHQQRPGTKHRFWYHYFELQIFRQLENDTIPSTGRDRSGIVLIPKHQAGEKTRTAF